MKRQHQLLFGGVLRIVLAAAAVAIFGACQTVPSEIPEDKTPPQLFQRAQEAVDNDNFGAALAYYEAVLDRFGDSPEISTIALYEIGFTHYRQGRKDKARPYFERVTERYENAESGLPEWPLVLSRRFLDRMS